MLKLGAQNIGMREDAISKDFSWSVWRPVVPITMGVFCFWANSRFSCKAKGEEKSIITSTGGRFFLSLCELSFQTMASFWSFSLQIIIWRPTLPVAPMRPMCSVMCMIVIMIR